MSHVVDIVFCIDCTGSMGPVIDNAKKFALGFQDMLKKKLEGEQKAIDQLRVKVISFRDYFVDGDQSMIESRFFDLPGEAEDYASFVNGLRPMGGGDEPESALEALALAIRSDWNTAEGRKRQLVCMLTDASAHPFEKAAKGAPPGYPTDMPKSLDELAEIWEMGMNSKARRLLVFAPESYPWSKICPDQGGFSAAIHAPSSAGHGLADTDYDTIVQLIANSI